MEVLLDGRNVNVVCISEHWIREEEIRAVEIDSYNYMQHTAENNLKMEA